MSEIADADDAIGVSAGKQLFVVAEGDAHTLGIVTRNRRRRIVPDRSDSTVVPGFHTPPRPQNDEEEVISRACVAVTGQLPSLHSALEMSIKREAVAGPDFRRRHPPAVGSDSDAADDPGGRSNLGHRPAVEIPAAGTGIGSNPPLNRTRPAKVTARTGIW